MEQHQRGYTKYAAIAFLSYFSLSAISSFLALYLESIGYTGIQIGSVNFMKSLVTIIAPLVLGVISDNYKKHKQVFIGTMAVSLGLMLLLPFTTDYIWFLIFFTGFSFFQVTICPLADGLLVHSNLEFGKLRKWGSIGFALASLITGYTMQEWGAKTMFIVFGIALLVQMIPALKIQVQIAEDEKIHLFRELKGLLKNKRYVFILMVGFFITMTFINNGAYFGLLYKSLGGDYSGVGMFFLLATGSETVFMQSANRVIDRFGHVNVMLFAASISLVRWILYVCTDSAMIVMISFILHGISIGLFLVASMEYIKKIVRPSFMSTAISVYTAMFLGVGGMIGGYLGGYLYQYHGIKAVYLMLAVSNVIGLLVLGYVKRLNKRKKKDRLLMEESNDSKI